MLAQLVAVSVLLSRRAGNAIRRISAKGDLKVVNKGNEDKGEFDPQTEADCVSQCIIVNNLRRRFPNCTIVAEEDEYAINVRGLAVNDEKYDGNGDACVMEKCRDLAARYKGLNQEDFVVWIDPLDGTSDFTQGLKEHVTVLIGIALKSGEPVAGIIHQPFYKQKLSATIATCGRTVWGIVGLGAFHLDDLSSLKPSGFVVATTKGHVDELVLSTMSALKADHVDHSPGAGFKALRVLEKVVDAFVYPGTGTRKWDTCASDALFRCVEPPLVMTDFFNKPIDYGATNYPMNSSGIIGASSATLHTTILDLIPPHVLCHLCSKGAG